MRASTWVMVALLMATMLGTGCRRGPAPAPENSSQAAAVQFYQRFFLRHDMSGAWDMTTEEWRVERTGSKEQWLQLFGAVEPRPLGAYDMQEYERGDDRLYLISDARDRYLIWVTRTKDGWRVRRHDYYKGGEIPW